VAVAVPVASVQQLDFPLLRVLLMQSQLEPAARAVLGRMEQRQAAIVLCFPASPQLVVVWAAHILETVYWLIKAAAPAALVGAEHETALAGQHHHLGKVLLAEAVLEEFPPVGLAAAVLVAQEHPTVGLRLVLTEEMLFRLQFLGHP
jgi:hypothetical protein